MIQRSDLGCECRDIVTDFVGVMTGYVEYLSGCHQALLVPKVDREGKLQEPQWFDVQRVYPNAAVTQIVLNNNQTPGPDRPAPKR